MRKTAGFSVEPSGSFQMVDIILDVPGSYVCKLRAVFREIRGNVTVDVYGVTALCPNFGIDSVIGESSGFDITTEFLRAMNSKWFQSGNGSSIHTPFGNVEIELDDKPHAIHYEMLDPLQYNVDGLAKITFTHKKSRKHHYLKIYLKDCQQKFFAESGERLEASSVDIGEGRLTIAFCDEFYTNFNESAVDGSYLSDGLEIAFPPKLSSQDYTLSVAWVNKVEGDDDVRTWLAVSC